ncbi:unnamed protein product [Adineta ricciae]|uniref:Uncharacterized protein n=1 Tax=Adineta ricciae TaxID=249248 RepID=A0A815I7C0_ADIRI|nr:unnamed protein product [Adineta ricciae]
MSGRTPSFIVVGLVIIMFLLGLFYMSCSSKNTELRLSVEQFEDRIRSLTKKNSDADKKVDDMNSRKRELEEEKLNLQKQMEKKDSEINDLNTKLNEKNAEIESLKSDKTVADEQLKELKTVRDTLTEKSSLIEQLQQQLQNLKQSGNDELTRLKQEYETLKSNRPSQDNQVSANISEQSNAFPIPPKRYEPIVLNNQTTRSLSALFQDPLNKLNNLTKEVKADIVPAVIDMKDRALNALGINTNLSTTTVVNDQHQVGQNVPPPPAAAQMDNLNQENQLGVDNLRKDQRFQRSFDNGVASNRYSKFAVDQENNEKKQLGVNNFQENNNNYRIANRDQDRMNRNEQRLDNGEEIENDDENDDVNQRRRKRSVL